MSIFERILGIDETTFDKLMSSGVLRSNAKRDLLIYEYYLNEVETCGSMQAIINASEKFYLSTEGIKKVIYKYKQNSIN